MSKTEDFHAYASLPLRGVPRGVSRPRAHVSIDRYYCLVRGPVPTHNHITGQMRGMRGSGSPGRISRMAPLRERAPVVPGI